MKTINAGMMYGLAYNTYKCSPVLGGGGTTSWTYIKSRYMSYKNKIHNLQTMFRWIKTMWQSRENFFTWHPPRGLGPVALLLQVQVPPAIDQDLPITK